MIDLQRTTGYNPEHPNLIDKPEQSKCKICNGTGHYTSEKAYEADCGICGPPTCITEQPNTDKKD